MSAKEDLERWKRVTESLPSLLKEALDARDIEKLKAILQDVSLVGSMASSVDGLSEAHTLVRRYDAQSKALRDAVATRNGDRLRQLLAKWCFEPHDPLVLEAQQLLDSRDILLEQLREAVGNTTNSSAMKLVDGAKVLILVNAWVFEDDNADLQAARRLSEAYLSALKRLEQILQEPKPNLLALKAEFLSWEFAADARSGGWYTQARALLEASAEEINAAEEAKAASQVIAAEKPLAQSVADTKPKPTTVPSVPDVTTALPVGSSTLTEEQGLKVATKPQIEPNKTSHNFTAEKTTPVHSTSTTSGTANDNLPNVGSSQDISFPEATYQNLAESDKDDFEVENPDPSPSAKGFNTKISAADDDDGFEDEFESSKENQTQAVPILATDDDVFED